MSTDMTQFSQNDATNPDRLCGHERCAALRCERNSGPVSDYSAQGEHAGMRASLMQNRWNGTEALMRNRSCF